MGGDEASKQGSAPRDQGALPGAEEASFTAHIVSLSSMGMVHLGVIPDPDSGECKLNLPLAQHIIDVLRMLREKTRGNLDEREAELLSDLLYRLQLRYVEAARASEASRGKLSEASAPQPDESPPDAKDESG